MATVLSVNVGTARLHPGPEEGRLTAIDKRPVAEPVAITASGVAGNECADRAVHGDEFMRVYAYAEEDYRWWSERLGSKPRAGLFGEQLTTIGMDLTGAVVGERWRVGSALLQVAHVRIPCRTFQDWMAESGFDADQWVRRFTEAGRPGPYLSVLEEGAVSPGDPIVVEHRPEHGLTVGDLFGALTVRPDLLGRVAGVEGLKPSVYDRVRARS